MLHDGKYVVDLAKCGFYQLKIMLQPMFTDDKKLMDVALYFKDLYFKCQDGDREENFKFKYEIECRLVAIQDEFIRRALYYEPERSRYDIITTFHKSLDRRIKQYYCTKRAA